VSTGTTTSSHPFLDRLIKLWDILAPILGPILKVPLPTLPASSGAGAPMTARLAGLSDAEKDSIEADLAKNHPWLAKLDI
jgi:hypothetical protein